MITKILPINARITISVITFLLFLFVGVSKSQNCLPPDVFSRPHFKPGIIYYYFENIPDSPEKNQIIDGINKWNFAIANRPCPSVELRMSFFARGVRIKYGSVPNQGAARYDEGPDVAGESESGTLTINKDLEFSI